MRKKGKTPKVGIVVVIVDQKYRYLLSSQPKAGTKGVWSFPGGNLKNDETITRAIHRVVKEETGCRVQHIGIMENHYSESCRYPDGYFYHIFFFKATVFAVDTFDGSKRRKHNGKNYTIKWAKKKDFPKNLMEPLPGFLLKLKGSQELLD